MEQRTEKITSVIQNQRQYPGKVGTIFIHHIRFENDKDNKIWEYHSQKETCENFKEGQVATFETNITVNGNFTNYKISPPKEQNGGKSYSGKSGKTGDSGIITYLSCFSSACDFYAKKLQASEEDVFAMTETAFKKALEKSTNK